jgi:hypothetical protein
LSQSDDTLFIGIVRNAYDWFNCLYAYKHHLPEQMCHNTHDFLTKRPHPLINTKGIPLKNNFHIYKKRPYHNLFELRKVKNHFLLYDMPTMVKHYILIPHEDLIYDFDNTMNLLRLKGLPIKKDIIFPKKIDSYYEGSMKKQIDFVRKNRTAIPKSIIMSKLDLRQEKEIFGTYLTMEE